MAGVTKIEVETDRWLGITKSYVVRVDGNEVGRLGRWNKKVVAAVDPGHHAVVVEAFGRRTAPANVEVSEAGTVTLDLDFPSYRQVIGEAAKRSSSRRMTDPIGSNESVIQLRVRS